MKTERLYYDQTYLREFEARVVSVKEDDGSHWWIALDRSAFYPTSGGQPYDTGCIGDAEVSNVEVDKTGIVYHRTDRCFTAGDSVKGIIDWERRFDHMQQHGGEHMLAGAIWEMLRGTTIGLHLGDTVSTIDVTMPDGRTRLRREEVIRIEEMVNRRIQNDDAIRCWFPADEELAALPLRKEPTVKENIRIVQIGDYEMVACGGTHPSSTGQIGSIYITDVSPVRGKVRFSFVCGARATRLYRKTGDASDEACRLLSSTADMLPKEISRVLEQHEKTLRELRAVQTQLLCFRFGNAADEQIGDVRVCAMYEPGFDADAASDAISEWIRTPGRIVLFSNGKRLVYAASGNVDADMAGLMKKTAKGGGKKDFATGAGGMDEIEKAKDALSGML